VPGRLYFKKGIALVRQLRGLRWGEPRDEGQALVEYALILLLVALVSIPILSAIGLDLATAFGNVSQAIP
jgi:Flp pilus assembly pilin Flp